MMKRRLNGLFLIMILLVVGCKKTPIHLPQGNDPVFRLHGTVGTESIDMVAGDDGAYMYTDLKTENGVHVFSGNLSDGTTEVEIEIYDGKLDFPERNVKNELPAELNFGVSSDPSVPLAVISKDMLPNAQRISEAQWYVNGEWMGTDEIQISEPGRYEVCGMFTFTDNSTGELCSDLILGYEKQASCSIKHYLNQNGVLAAWVDDQGNPIEKIKWFLDDELISDEYDLSREIGEGNYYLRAEVHFMNGVVRSKSMLVDGSLSGKFIDDLSFFESTIEAPTHRDFNVDVRVKMDGKDFYSNRVDNSSSLFSIQSIDYYGYNQEGDRVQKMTATISAVVATVQGEERQIEITTEFGVPVTE